MPSTEDEDPKLPVRSAADISVVVPCHNYGRFLTEALTSIDTQTVAPDEVVVVDDGSTDDTSTIIESFIRSHPGTVLLSRSPARGVVSTLNDGVRATSSRLVVILSADDTMSPDYLEGLADAIDRTGADFAYASVHFFGNRTGTWTARSFSSRRLARTNYVNTSAMFRRELFDAVGGFDPAFGPLGREDWAFWIAAVDRGARGVAVPSVFLGYRRHPKGSRNDMSLRRVIALHTENRRRWPRVVSRVDLAAGILLDCRVWLFGRFRDRLRARRLAKVSPV